MKVVDEIHERHALGRRVRVLTSFLAPQIPSRARVLEVGSGDGRLTRSIAERRPDVQIEAVDVLPRPDAEFAITLFDGKTLPHADGSFDLVLLVDVLHHADDPRALLAEARRVTRRHVLLKDHTLDGWLAGPTLRFMDRVGNARHGVSLPFNYLSTSEWTETFRAQALDVETWYTRLHMYPWPLTLCFDRRLHFVALLAKAGRAQC